MQEADGSYTCLPAYQLPPPHPKDGGKETCNALSTVRGYLLVSHGARMSVFNTTADARLLFTKEKSGPGVLDDSGGETEEEGCGVAPGVSLAPPWTVLSSYSSSEVLVVEAKSCSAVSRCLGVLRFRFFIVRAYLSARSCMHSRISTADEVNVNDWYVKCSCASCVYMMLARPSC